MASIVLNRVRKVYGEREVIPPLDLAVEDGEFLVLLGPSGCGKSTLLRMIAGLQDLDGGSISFDGRDVSRVEPARRGTAFMFQSYALYPHWSTRHNVAFPLVIARFRWFHYIPGVSSIARILFSRSGEVRSKVESTLERFGLSELGDVKPGKLSGGQRQRVALARAMVREPEVFLLDEPLSNLDAKLRTHIRSDLAILQRELGRTFIYVTHDQVEAMTMASRIVVMDRGVIQQVGTPQEIYRDPVNVFVAEFVGTPPMNVFPRAVLAAGDDSLLVGVRPEDIALSRSSDVGGLPARVVGVEALGSHTVQYFELDALPGKTMASIANDESLYPGDAVQAVFDLRDSTYFDPSSGLALPKVAAELA